MSTESGPAVPGWDAAIAAGTEAHRAREAEADASDENFATDGELAAAVLAAALPLVLAALEAQLDELFMTCHVDHVPGVGLAARVVATYRKGITE